MKILILSLFYPPEPLKIFSDLSEQLQATGNHVTVITAYPNWPAGQIYDGYKNGWPTKSRLNGVSIVRVPIYQSHSRSTFRRAISYLSFAISASLFAIWKVPRPEAIYAVEPPSTAFAAWTLSKFWKVPFIYEVLDMWPETPRDTGMLTNRWLLRVMGLFCRWIYSQAASIRVISEGQRNNLIQKNVPADKLFLIPIWVNSIYYTAVDRDHALELKCNTKGRFTIIYTGNLGLAQGLDTVLAAANNLRDLPNLIFLFFGDGAEGPALRRKAKAMNLSNLTFMGSYPSASMKNVYSIADCLLVHLHNMPAFRMAIPHKILSYLACGKPIIAALAGDGAELVRAADAGLICPPDDSVALSHTVRALFNMTPEERSKLGNNGRRAAEENFGIIPLVGKIEQMIKRTAHAPQSVSKS